MKTGTKKYFSLSLTVAVIVLTSSASSQGFDLMNVSSSNKVAASAHYTVTKNGIEQFRIQQLTSPYLVVTGDTLFVDNNQSTTTVADGGTMPRTSTLQQNFPNPFNNSTVIRYSVKEMSDVTITVFDMTGREVTTLVNGKKDTGVFSVGFSNNAIASGTYVYRMTAKDHNGKTTVETKKMIVMK